MINKLISLTVRLGCLCHDIFSHSCCLLSETQKFPLGKRWRVLLSSSNFEIKKPFNIALELRNLKFFISDWTQCYCLFTHALPRYIFLLVLRFVEDSKTEKISFVNTLSCWFIFLFSFPLGTFSTLNQPLSNYLDNRLVKLFIFALNAALLFHGHDIHARIAFRRRVKDIEISFVNTLSS